ncbi:MAG: Gfo/Idh/MocA family oxidoreductase [Pseudomonadota bacterium]
MSPDLRVAVLGAGYFAQFHYEAWSRIPEVHLVGAADQDITRAQATGLPAFANLDALIEQTNPDLLDIATPPPTHATAIARAIDAGISTVICQKPFCTSHEEAIRVTSLAERAGLRLIIHENFRFQPWYRTIKGALDAGEIGDPLQVTFRLRPGDGQGPRAYLDRQPYFQTMERFLIHETGVHWVDTFRYLLGNPTAVYADLRRLNPVIAGEDAGYVLFDHGPARALFDGNRLLDHKAEQTRLTMGEAMVEGTRGTLSLSGDGAVQSRRFGEQDNRVVLPPQTYQGFGGDCVYALQSHVVASVLHGAAVENAAADYLSVLDIEDAIYRSAAGGQKVSLSS